jgi:hypothetical protein
MDLYRIHMPNIKKNSKKRTKYVKKSSKKKTKKKTKKNIKGGTVLKTGLNNPCLFGTGENGICATKQTLNSLKNKLIKDGKIEHGGTIDNKQILDIAKKTTNCDSEECIYNKLPDLDDLKNSKKNLKEKGPARSLDWLDNYNIDNVLEKWTFQHKDFKHIPFHMIDFEKYNTELKNLNLKNLINAGYKNAAVVLNTDVSTGRGIHWFCLFFDFSKSPMTIEYFNSSGEPPMREIRNFINKIKTPEFQVIENKVRHQQDTNSECGLFSLYYIINRLKGIPQSDFNTRVPDKEMIKFRQDLFV